jgi:hypothetical protein
MVMGDILELNVVRDPERLAFVDEIPANVSANALERERHDRFDPA